MSTHRYNRVPRMRRSTAEWLVLLAVLLMSGLLIAYFIWNERQLLLMSNIERMRLQTVIIDENLSHQLEGVRSALDSARSAFSGTAACPGDCRRILLQSLKRAMPGVRALLVVDRDGAIVMSDDDLRDARLDDRDYTRNVGRMRAPDTLYLSQPYENTPGVFNIKLSMARAPADGGVVSAILNPGYFDAVMRSALYAPDMNSAITEDSGRRILFVPADPAAMRRDTALPDPFFTRHQRSGRTETVLTGDSDGGERRLVVQRTMLLPGLGLDKSLVVSLGRKEAVIAAGWRGMAWTCDLAWLLFGLGASAALLVVQRRRHALEELERERERKIAHLAFYDGLTKLPNRRLLLDRLQLAIAKAARGGSHGAVLFVDLDNFKSLNDTLGHDIGDRLLEMVALRLQQVTRGSDTVARLGGDEFVILLEDLGEAQRTALDNAAAVAAKVVEALSMHYPLAGHDVRSTPSIGVALFDAGHHTINDLLRQADMAMYEAKAAGRATFRFFDPRMQVALDASAALEAEMRNALARHELRLHYQPVVDGDARVTGVEALLRWQHPQRGLIAPCVFIPQAEKSGLIVELGDWVLETACLQLVRWSGAADTAALTIAVNISARQFRQPAFAEQVLAVVASSGADPRLLKLELTETMLLSDMDDVIVKMTALKARGIGFALDDFGTGYCSLNYLRRLPIEQLKIDRSFVQDMLHTRHAASIVRAIITLADSMGLDVVAEGVENEEQRAALEALGCTHFQGYLFGRPAPLPVLSRGVGAGREEGTVSVWRGRRHALPA